MTRLPEIGFAILALSGFAFAADEGNWPQFRGPSASGVADGQQLPDRWDAETGEGIKFKVEIPGLAHSSPIIWGDRIFLTTAVSSDPAASFQPGLYGSGDASPDQTKHEWRVLCLGKNDGRILWNSLATSGVPKDKRHIKSTYANSTPATDGKRVVALFGSEGLFAFDFDGKLLWKKDLGRMDVGAYDLPSYEWGPASSPIIHNGKVIVQIDTQADSFLLAADVETGETLWKTPREELPSWGTPTVFEAEGKRAEIITNGSNFVRGYDAETGVGLWRLDGSSKITAPTPIFSAEDGLVIVASGRAPERPIFAIRPGGEGDITQTNHVAWRHFRRGPYMPTPIIYDGLLFVLNNSGPFACYDLKTGAERFHLRLPHRGNGFSASPVAADGKLYFPSEDGITFVVVAGPEFELLAENSIGEPIMASPALSEGVLFLRGQKNLFAIGKK